MKALIISLALAGVGAIAPLDAQMSTRNPANTQNVDYGNNSGQWYSIGRDASGYSIYERRTRDNNGNTVIQRARRNSNGSMTIISTRTVGNDNNNNTGNTSGSWYSVGRDANGYSIYERRTRDNNGNIVIQRARRDSNGSMTIISTRTVRDDRRDDRRDNRNCDYSRSTNSVGDILFGRTNDRDCDDDYSRDDNGWYQVGRGPNNNSIYERRTRDSNGNLIIQRARRNSNGTMTIISTRRYSDNDKHWKRAQKAERKEDKREEKWERKEDKRDDRRDRKDDKRDDRRDDRDDRRDGRR